MYLHWALAGFRVQVSYDECMTAREGGFLASRVLAVYLGTAAISLIPFTIQQFQMMDRLGGASLRRSEAPPFMRDIMPWAQLGTVAVFLIGSLLLWYLAPAFGSVLAHPDPETSSAREAAPTPVWYRFGFRLIGLYILLSNVPGVISGINYVVEEYQEDVWSWSSRGC
jgi:hypothetical protein